MKSCTSLSWLLLLIAGAAFLSGQSYSDDQLFQMGNQAWQQTECVKVGQYFFAYLLRNPDAVRNNPAFRTQLEKVIDWCVKNTTVYANAKGDSPGGVSKPVINMAIPPTGQRSSPVQRRCDIYATLAVAQSSANSANRCGYAGNRWDPRYNFHYDYCVTAPAYETFSETQTRQSLLTQCAP